MPDFDIGRVLVLPGRRIGGLVLRINSKSDVIVKAVTTAQRQNVVIRYMSLSPISPEENRMILFLDLTESRVKIEDVAAELEAIASLKVEGIIRPTVEGFISDTFSDRLVSSGTRIIILRELGYMELLRGIRQSFGAGGEAFLYHIGFMSGVGFAKIHKRFAEAIGIKEPAEIYQKISKTMFQWAGFGRVEVKFLGPEHIEVFVYNSFECELGRGRAIPYSHFVRGIIGGTLGELFERPFTVTEIRCIAKGDPYCQFEATTKIEKDP